LVYCSYNHIDVEFRCIIIIWQFLLCHSGQHFFSPCRSRAQIKPFVINSYIYMSNCITFILFCNIKEYFLPHNTPLYILFWPAWVGSVQSGFKCQQSNIWGRKLWLLYDWMFWPIIISRKVTSYLLIACEKTKNVILAKQHN